MKVEMIRLNSYSLYHVSMVKADINLEIQVNILFSAFDLPY